MGSKSFSSFSLSKSLLIQNSASLWFNVFLAALSPACCPPYKGVLENRHVGNQKCQDNLIRTMGNHVFSQKTEQLRSREGFIRRENGLGKRLGSKHMGCIYFCKMEATASVTPGATIGVPRHSKPGQWKVLMSMVGVRSNHTGHLSSWRQGACSQRIVFQKINR